MKITEMYVYCLSSWFVNLVCGNRICWFYGIWQDNYIKVPEEPHFVFKEGLPPVNFVNTIDKSVHNVAVIDDLMTELQSKEGEVVLKLFTRGSHHANLTVILITQNLFFKTGREYRLNSHYLTLFKNPVDMSIVSSMSKQMFHGNKKAAETFREVYEQATSEQRSYLFISIKTGTPVSLRFRSNVFGEGPQIAFSITA